MAGCDDQLKHGAEFIRDVVIPKAQYRQTKTSKNEIALGVVFLLTIVNFTVYLDDEIGLPTIEIHDEARNHLLTVEMKSIELIGPQPAPE